MELIGVGKVKARLKRIGKRTNRAALAAVRRGAEEIADLAADYAPVDEGNLEDSIVVAEERSGNSRIVIFIGVDPSRLGLGYKRYGFRYDIQMHEGVYNLGPLSQKKNSELGGGVGPKYLERALEELEEEIRTDVENAMRRQL